MISASNRLGLFVISIDAIFLTLSAIALAVRISSRILQSRRLSLNDYLTLLAWVIHSIADNLKKLTVLKSFAGALVSTAIIGTPSYS